MPHLTLATRLRNFAARPVVRNIAKVGAGNAAGNAVNFLAMLLLLALEPSDYAVFVVLQNFILLFASLSDFGLNTTIIKSYRSLETLGRAGDAEALMRRSLWVRLAIIAMSVGAGVLLAAPITRHWPRQLIPLGPATAAYFFRLACLGALGASLWAFCQAAMQARQQFGLYALLTTANHGLRLALIAALIWWRHLNIASALVIIMAVPFLGIVSSARLWPRRFWAARMEPGEMRRQWVSIFHFSKWIFVSMIVGAFLGRLNVFMLEGLGDTQGVAQFGAAQNLAQGIPILIAAVSAVLLPKFAATRSRREMKRVLGIFLRLTPLLIAAAAGAIVLAHWAMPLVKGGKYQACLPVFDMLVAGMSLSVVGNPLSYFCLAFDRTRWLAWMNLAQLALAAGLSLLLIPRLGFIGAGISELAWRAFGMIVIGLAFRHLLRIAEE